MEVGGRRLALEPGGSALTDCFAVSRPFPAS